MLSFYACADGGLVGNSMILAWNTAPDKATWLENPPLTGGWQRYSIKVRRQATGDSLFFYLWGAKTGNVLLISNLQVEVGDAVTGWAPQGISAVNPLTESNVGVVIPTAVIGLAQINRATINSLSAITANMGTVTINPGGYMRGGQADYAQGAGFFLGWSGGTYKFSINGTNGSGLEFDGANLNMKVFTTSTTFLGVMRDCSQGDWVETSWGAGATADVVYGRNGSGWYTDGHATVGDGYWIRATKTSGFTPTSGTLGTWLQLSADRYWALSVTNATRTCTLKIEISTSSSGTPVVSAGTVTLSAQSNAGAPP